MSLQDVDISISAVRQRMAVSLRFDNSICQVPSYYYRENNVKINYTVASGYEGFGSVSPASEEVKAISGTVNGSVASPIPGYKLEGWYIDADCQNKVGSESKFVPQKPETGVWEEKTYYAKFEQDVADLTISKSGCQAIDENQSFIFNVTGPDGFSMKVTIEGNGSVMIKGLKIGDYTVTEETGWSWRYTPKTGSHTITLQATGNNVTFENERMQDKWLNGCAYKSNKFKSPIAGN